MAQIHNHRQRISRLLTLLLPLSALIGLWVFGLTGSEAYRVQLLEKERSHLLRLASSVTSQIDRLFETIRRDLNLLDYWVVQHPNQDPRFEPHFHGLVERLRADSHHVLDYRAVDAQGGLFYFPSSSAAPLADVSDREYFKVQTEPNTRGFYIGKPVKSRVTGQWGVPISVPLSESVAGLTVLFAALELDRIMPDFEAVRPQPDGAIGIARSDSTLLARVPAQEDLLGRRILSPPGAEYLASGALMADYQITSPFDGLRKLIVYSRPRPDSLFYITCSVSLEEALATWQANHGRLLLSLSLMTALLLSLAGTLWFLQNELERRNRRLTESALAKSRFLAQMSHELRTPLTALIGLTEMMGEAALPAEAGSTLKLLKTSALQLKQLVDDVLDWSSIEAGRIPVRRQEFSWQDLLQSSLEAYRPQVKAKNLSLNFHTEPGLPASLVSDPARLRQIFINLLSNAVKFTESGGVTVRVEAGTGPGGRRWVLSVADTGRGISPEEARRLFQPYTQLDQSLTRPQGGTGLGLAISRELASALGGSLVLTQGQPGSVFTLNLPWPDAAEGASPLGQAGSSGPQAPQDAPGASELPGGSPVEPSRVLVVEDTPVSRLILEHHLKTLGCAVLSAENGRAALDLLARERVDLVLMDVQMPVLDGYSAVKQLRAAGDWRAQVPVLALTAHALEGEAEKSRAAGMNAHLTKPLVKEDLVAALKTWLPGFQVPER